MNLKTNEVCTLRESVIRNAPLGVAIFFGIIPFWGWIILVLLGIPLVALEIYLMMTLENGFGEKSLHGISTKMLVSG